MTTSKIDVTDDDLARLIVEAYRDEDLRVPLQAITRQRTRQVYPRLVVALACAVVVAILLAGGILAAGGGWPRSVGPAEPSLTVPAKPPVPTVTAVADGERCAQAAAQQQPPVDLPPQRFALTGPDPRLRLLLFGGAQGLVACWLNHDRVDVGGPSQMTDPVDANYALAAYGVDILDPAYAQAPAEYGFGKAMAGATAVQIRFATGDPLAAQLVDGWWAVLVVGELRFADATEIVFTTPSGEHSVPVTHG